ncbi:hypothetical protein QYE76_037885 [Lolium multiflorum]|uniref:Retrotransposon gag domain-containing protein n=1 Tax=Lolium multiflorum TaxID=4521 RepID=A0AAD8T7P4_LOLMU|nr:hypothetical protein QYE76_037885 [Lolium multiflorum]
MAPTVGPRASTAGVFFRTGLTTATGERVASGLVWRFGSLDCVSDNAGRFADRPFPAGGSIISFGQHDVYVAAIAPPRYPQQVLRCASPPTGAGASNTLASPCVVQVMTTGDENTTRATRVRGPNLERNADGSAAGSGPKAPPPPSRLDAARARLSTPLTAGADPTTIEADLEAHRQFLLKQAEEVAAAQRQLQITRREFDRAHGFTPAGNAPSRAGQIRRRGGDLGAEIDRDGAESPAPSMELPIYNTPEKNMRAAEAAAEELSRLEGEELRRQTRRVTELLHIASEQQKNPRYAANIHVAAGRHGGGPRDTAESSSPAPSRRRDSQATHDSPSRQSRLRSSGSGYGRPPPSRSQEHNSGQPEPRRPPQPAPEASGTRQPAHSRLGPRVEPVDARDRLDRLTKSRIAEEGAGPKCFGPRIWASRSWTVCSRGHPQVRRTAKPEDWLDYSTAVGIAKGNKRWAVRYSPLMLLGSARTWLNNLPAGSINGWLDFEEAFISNFTGTYRRPGRPLEMCKQEPDETDRAYLTRWCEMRNSCEGVHEVQAISFFMAGCRPNTMLWHKLRRSDPKTMAALMAIADKYALAEEAGQGIVNNSPAAPRRDQAKPAEHKPAEGATQGSRRDNYRGKRHSDQPDRRYGSAHVAAVADNASAGGSRRQRQDRDRPWRPKFTFEQMLDTPCKYHSGKNPSNHTTRDCHFTKRLNSGEPLPPPSTAGRGCGMGRQPRAAARGQHGPTGRYLAEDAAYIVFTSEPRRTSQRAPFLEVARSYRGPPGSSINILYRDTARKLGIQEAEFAHPTVFTASCESLLPADRTDRAGGNVREAGPLPHREDRVRGGGPRQPYHALLGRPALAKFMAVPHYGYLKMKLPGPKGVITIVGDYRRSMDCAIKSSKTAQTLIIATEKQLIHDAVAMAKAAQAGMPAVGNPAGTTHFQPANNTKQIPLDPAQPDKFVTIGAGLSSK